MNKKQSKTAGGMVFSTNPDFIFEDHDLEKVETLPPKQQKLIVLTDRKQRKGKTVTLVRGFKGSETDLKELGKKLKSGCGVGGSTKDGEILLQGDFAVKILAFLSAEGYSVKKSGG